MLKITTLTIFSFFIFIGSGKAGYINIDTSVGNTEGYQYNIVSFHLFNSAGAIDGVRAIFQSIPKKATSGEIALQLQWRSRHFAELKANEQVSGAEKHTFAPIYMDSYQIQETLILTVEQILDSLGGYFYINQEYESIDRWSITPYEDIGGI